MSDFTATDLKIMLARKRSIMLKLERLSEGGTTSLAPKIVNGNREAMPPGRISLKDGPPSAHDGLLAYHQWWFARIEADIKAARDQPSKIRQLVRFDLQCSKALRDYWLHTAQYKRPIADTDAENVARMLSEYNGVPAAEVAVWEMCSARWVRDSRRNNGVDPETGEDVIDGRKLKVREMAAAGLPQRTIAERVGVSRARVRQLLAA